RYATVSRPSHWLGRSSPYIGGRLSVGPWGGRPTRAGHSAGKRRSVIATGLSLRDGTLQWAATLVQRHLFVSRPPTDYPHSPCASALRALTGCAGRSWSRVRGQGSGVRRQAS